MIPSDGSVPVSSFTRVPGWLSDEEEKHLMFHASQVPEDGTIVEVGSEYGRSTCAFLAACSPSVKMVSIDVFPDDHPVVGDLRAAFEANVKEAGFGERLRVAYRTTSEKAASLWPEQPLVDLLFIDGDHEYSAVSLDITSWRDKISVGGLMIFHDVAPSEEADCHPIHKEVRRAVLEFMDEDDWVLEEVVESLWVYRRRYDPDQVVV